LLRRYLEVIRSGPTSRGYELEKLLADVFDAFNLDPRASFRVVRDRPTAG
jgi:hypothetical protein